MATTFARYCLPTIFFMGVHVVMGQILNARGKFGAMMWTPVLNNIVMIVTFGLFIWVYGTSHESQMGVTTIPPEGVRLLGIGTLLGLVVQALAMIPYLREAGFRFRPRFDWRGHGLGKTVRLAKWTVLFVLANQAGVLVVTQLATSAGKASGQNGAGFLAYSNAQLIWGMPQAIITVSVMAALLPRISRAAHDNDPGAVRDDISQGLRNSAVAIVPVAFAFLALGVPMCTLLYASSGPEAARSMGFILMAFGLGLIPYSVQYVVLRGFYAYEDTRTPFYNTVIVALVNAAASAVCYVVLPAQWAVVGMAASYGLAYAVGVGIAWRRLPQPPGRRPGRSARPAHLRPSVPRGDPCGSDRRRGGIRPSPHARRRRFRLAPGPALWRDRAAGGLRRRGEADADRRDQRHGRDDQGKARPLRITSPHNHRRFPRVVHGAGVWAQLA